MQIRVYNCIKITFRKGMGNPTSTNSNCEFSRDDVLSMSLVKWVCNIFTPSFVFKSHLFVKSIVFVSFSILLVVIIILSELRILQIVDVDSRFFPKNIGFPNILLINVDFPLHVSPEIAQLN